MLQDNSLKMVTEEVCAKIHPILAFPQNISIACPLCHLQCLLVLWVFAGLLLKKMMNYFWICWCFVYLYVFFKSCAASCSLSHSTMNVAVCVHKLCVDTLIITLSFSPQENFLFYHLSPQFFHNSNCFSCLIVSLSKLMPTEPSSSWVSMWPLIAGLSNL